MVGGLRVRPRIDPRWVRTDGSRDCRGGPRDDRSAAGSDIPHSSSRAHRDRGGAVNPADLEILQTGLSFIPEEMGVAFRRTAYSPNIKERMDASCAIFDAEGRIVAQAARNPVHLGSMPATATRLEDEGLVLGPQKVMDRGRERQAVVERFRQETMNPAERLGDLRAQIAANELGARRLVELAERIGVTNLRTSIEELL